MFPKYLTLKGMIDELKKSVKGQDDTVNNVSLAVYKHYLRHASINVHGIGTTPALAIIGKTGTGKTFLVKKAAELSQLPFIEISATELGLGGAWVGTSLTDIIKKSGKREGIVFIDEIDKIISPSISSSGNDVHKEIQHTLLKTIEGLDVNELDTSRFLFILAGAFTELLEEEKLSTPIGFTHHEGKIEPKRIEDSLLEFGMIPELLGRISTVSVMNDINETTYREILKSPELDFNKWCVYIKDMGLTMEAHDAESLVRKAMTENLGIRGLMKHLESTINKSLLDNQDKVDINREIALFLGDANEQFTHSK